MICITTAAQAHFEKLLLSKEVGTEIRVLVINPGTPKGECHISYCHSSAAEATDIKLTFDKFSVYIDQFSEPYLQGAEIDFVIDTLNSYLTLKAPNIKMHRVNKDAPLITRVEHLLQSQINPQLANHGGHVKIIEITDDMLVILQFGGGCNGCSMVDFTLKEGIEKKLLEQFTELRGVRDFTEHQRGNHSYY